MLNNAIEQPKERAFLISPYLNVRQKEECEEHLEELKLLAETYGAEVVGKVPCLLRKIEASTLLSSGKLEEMVALAKDLSANLIIVDQEIAPSQQRNLENAFGLRVMDRTELILEVFAARAQTKEARLQIELAQVKYEAPRLKRLWGHLSRQRMSGAGGGYLKGEGEKQIEIDRRILKRRIEKLQAELAEVRKNRDVLRLARGRSEIPTFALIGYTNAGKSTLMNALTDAGVFVEDKLFATLDTTTRKFLLPNNQEILLIDTVGFIRKLPHLLVAAFKSTLEEALFADILLHIVDISHPSAIEQAKTTFEVLKELHADDRPIIHVLNKVDLAADRKLITRFKIEYPHTVEVSALTGLGIPSLIEKMEEELKKRRSLVTLRIPQSEYEIASAAMRLGHVSKVEYEGNDVVMTVEIPQALKGKWQKYIQT
jgi:GTP-binding protein HflX